MKNKVVRDFVFVAILIALMFTFAWTPLGMIPIGVLSATTVFIPVAIGIIVLNDWKYTFLLGISFGFVSWIRALVAPSTVLDPFFQNPIVSVLPRFLMAIVCHYCYRVIIKVKNESVRYGLIGGCVALFNTIFTISILCIVYYEEITELLLSNNLTWTSWLFAGIALTNMLPEIALGILVSIPIGKTFNKLNKEKL